MLKVDEVQTSLARSNIFKGQDLKINMSGKQILVYNELVDIANTVSNTIAPLLIEYNKSIDT